MILVSVLLWLTCLSVSIHALPHHQQVVARASSGCGKAAFLPGITQYRFFKSGGKDRSYSYHLPSSYDSNKAYAVVVGFHGSSSIGAFFELDTKMSQEKYSSDKIMIYPNGIGGSWAGPTYHDGSTVADDIQFVKDITEDVKERFCIDEQKVFGAG
jgi:poly(3-hydroxybutyrate) depolymerase